MSSSQLWGPPLWHFIHTVCKIDYKDISKNKSILKNISDCLPFNCYCKILYDQYLPLLDSIDTNIDIYKWSVTLHNIVNEKLGKSIYTPSEGDMHLLDDNDITLEDHLWKYIHNILKINTSLHIPESSVLQSNLYYLDKILNDLDKIEKIILDQELKEFYKNKMIELKMVNKDDLIKRAYIYNWSIDIHNERNTLLGKPLYIDN